MGKASALSGQIAARPLSPAEIEERQEADVARGADLETTLDGRVVVRPSTPKVAPRTVTRAATETWD